MPTSSPAFSSTASRTPRRVRRAAPHRPLPGETFGAAVLRPAGSTTTVVVVRGEVDRETGPALLACLLGQLKPAGRALLVDLRAVTFLDAAGLRVLLTARQTARGAGVPLRFRCGDRRWVRRLLETTGLLDEVRGEGQAWPDGSRCTALPSTLGPWTWAERAGSSD